MPNMNIPTDYLIYLAFVAVGLLAGWLLGRRNRPASDHRLTFEEAMRRWEHGIKVAEGSALNNLAATTPYLATAIPASIAYKHMTAYLDFGPALALVAAACVEFLGLAAVHTSFQLWDWNEQKNQTEQEAPVKWAIISGIVYLVIVVTVNVILESSNVGKGNWSAAVIAEIIAKALLSLLSVVAAFVLALRSQHARRLAVKEQVKQDRRDAYELGRLRKLVGELETAVSSLRDELQAERDGAAALELSNISLVEKAEKLQAENERLQERFSKLQTAVAQKLLQQTESNHSANGSSATGYTDWRKIPQEVRTTFADMTPEKILEENPGIVSKTAENWIKLSGKLRKKLSKEGGQEWGTW